MVTLDLNSPIHVLAIDLGSACGKYFFVVGDYSLVLYVALLGLDIDRVAFSALWTDNDGDDVVDFV